MSIIYFRFTGTANRLRIIATGTDDDNHPIGKEYICYLAPLPAELIQTIELEQQAFSRWLCEGAHPAPIPVETNNPDSSQSGIETLAFTQPPIPMQTNNSSFILCQQLGEHKTRLFKQWIDSPPPPNSNSELLESSASLQGKLSNILSSADYNQNRNNHSFVIHTDTDDPELGLMLQKLPFHTCGLIANYPKAEVAFSTTQHRIRQPSGDHLRVFVILGDDAAIDFEPHRQAIDRSLSTFAKVDYWSCRKDSPYSTAGSIAQPEQNLYEVLEDKIRTNTSPRILIFVGHSSSTQVKSNIQIQLNHDHFISLTTPAFTNILQQLKEKGLIFAAFFSCDGLNIARELNKGGIPYILVSRDRIPVHVALTSITEFFNATEPGVSINIALNRVRQYLQNHVETIRTENGCPNASNMLVLFQNPIQPAYILRPFTAKNWRQKIDENLRDWFPNKNLKYLMLGIIGIFLAFLASMLGNKVWEFTRLPQTACDIANIEKISYLSCGEKTLFKDQKFTAKDTIINEAKNSFDNSWNKYIDTNKPELAIALSNARNKLSNSLQPIQTIGVMLPLSDAILARVPELPTGMLSAVAQAQKEWNGNRGNWNLEVMLINDFNGEGKDGISIENIVDDVTTKLEIKPKILGLISNYSSDVTKRIIKKYNASQLMAVSGTTTATDFSEGYPYFVRTTITTDVQAKSIIEFIKNHQNIKNIKIISGDGVFVNSFNESLLDQAKKNNVNLNRSDITNLSTITDPRYFSEGIPKDGSTALIINLNPFQDGSQNPIKPVLADISHDCSKCVFIGSETTVDKWMWDFIKKKFKNNNDISSQLVLSLPYIHDIEINKDFSRAENYHNSSLRKSLVKAPVAHRVYLTYDATYLLLDAIDKGVKGNRKNEEIKTKLPELIRAVTSEGKYFGMTGIITFNGSDRAQSLYGLVTPKIDKNGDFKKFVIAK